MEVSTDLPPAIAEDREQDDEHDAGIDWLGPVLLYGGTALGILALLAAPFIVMGVIKGTRRARRRGAARTADRLERAVASARRATADLIGFAGSLRDAHAVSVPYLTLLGVLAGGWMHGLAVTAVAAHTEAHDGDEARRTLADFYGAHHLPRVHALAETVASGETR